MGQFEIQGIVSVQTGQPLVQFRQINNEGEVEFGFQLPPMEARDIAHNILEAAANAVYEAALIAWAKDEDREEIGIVMVDNIRKYRADRWGLPDNPEDWRGNN